MNVERHPNLDEAEPLKTSIEPVPSKTGHFYIDVTAGELIFRFYYKGLVSEQPVTIIDKNEVVFTPPPPTPEWEELQKRAWNAANEAIENYFNDALNRLAA